MPRLIPNNNSNPLTNIVSPALSFSVTPTPDSPATERPLSPLRDRLSFPASGSAETTFQITAPPPNATHTVQKGDSLGEIAKQYLGDFDRYMEIYELNKDKLMNPNDLRIGMELELPIPAAEPPANSVDFPLGEEVQAPPAAESTPETPREIEIIEHTVRPGESLSTIAREHLGDANRYREIFEANRDQLSSPDRLGQGMVLKVPVEKAPAREPASATPPPAPPAAETPDAEPTRNPHPPAAPPPSVEHTVGRGDTLSTIALRYLGDANRYMEIYEANRDKMSSPDRLSRGMVLTIPNGTDTAGESAPASEVSNVTDSDLNPRAQELLSALNRYQNHHRRLGNTNRAQTTPAEMREIAYELDRAATAFNVDPKVMLAVYGHESGGFDPRARSHTGAGGLGQLTGIAIRQVHHMAGMARGQRGRSPYTQYQDNFIQRTNRINDRFNIKRNIWTSTAYMSYEIRDRAHLGRGLENAVKRYGDPNVATYSDKVNQEYRILFGGDAF